jgi:hypothetical protein
MTEIGIVVPTTGQRPDYLPLALQSIRDAGDAFVVLVGTKGFDARPFRASGLIDLYLEEELPGVAAKINFGFKALPKKIKYINWLSDDDLLAPAALDIALARIRQPDQPLLVFGGCEYIDARGKKIFTNFSSFWAVALLRFGPQLIPQPGALFRREAFERIGGLKEEYGWAFDFDMFLSLSKAGKAVHVKEVLAKFRWHEGSLSVSKRAESVKEASRVRVAHLPMILKPVSFLWECPVRIATYAAGKQVSNILRRESNRRPG